MIEAVNNETPGEVLEIGIGTGSHLPLYNAHRVTGIDISEAMLKQATSFKSDNTNLVLMNGEDLSFNEASFDYVVISHVLAVTKDPNKLLGQVYKVLKPGGKLFILNHFTPGNWLRHIDRIFHPLSSVLHFKSLFYLHNIDELNKFRFLKQRDFGKFSYFKLIIYSRP